MKQFIKNAFLLLAIAATSSVKAQNAREVAVKYNKMNVNGIVADYDVPKKIVEDALQASLSKAGLGESKSSKGYRLYEGAIWPELSPEKLDLYTDVTGRKESSTVTILISKGYNNFISTLADQEKVERVKSFLNDLLIQAKSLELVSDIQKQEDAVKKAEKMYNNVVDDGAKLVRDREKIEKQMAENKAEQEKKNADWDVEKKKLEDMKAMQNKQM